MKKYHIYVYTPFHKNSKFIPHLLEHVLLQWPRDDLSWFLKSNDIIWKSRAFFTEYIIRCEKEELSEIISKLRISPEKKLISAEYPVIKDELNRKTYHAILYEKIWKKLISEKFNNNNLGKLNFNDLYEYFEKYYINWNIIILEDDIKFKELEKGYDSEPKRTEVINLQWFRECVYIWEMSLEQFFHALYLSEFYNSYLNYHYRTNIKKYSWDTTTFYFYDEFVCLSVPSELENTINLITAEFKTNWKIYMKNKLKNDDNEFLTSMDGAMMVKYGHTLSMDAKMRMIELL
ncbi:MAG: hypothetical protein ACD_2C00092G0007 [uncultured bacterium (gcode 4)]|uniref:Peptidase M16 N-terminal domain-containing protein n=1 Tax=uncultured bacterium (gcode 4) TaxID=1234023 RepID=K2GHA1_9BACT|nr:MAG: hypothetical protein ACD_2C00092G0007 [uncultured bacterium (gcode 4)]